MDYLIDLWSPGARGQIERMHIEQLRKLGVLTGVDIRDLKIDKKRADWLVKANHEMGRILARRRKS